MKQVKVCIIGGKCYDLIAGSPVLRYVGGIETQLVALAKGLVEEGCQVSLITFDHGQPADQEFHGVRVLKGDRPSFPVPVLRWWVRSRQLWRAMRKADADIYLQMGAGFETGQTASGCGPKGERGKRFVFCLASNMNYGCDLTAGRFGLEGKIYKYGLRRADLVLAQTVQQHDKLLEATGVESEVIPMAVKTPTQGLTLSRDKHNIPRIMWVGRILPEKRPEWLLEMARRCPELQFNIVGTPNRASQYAENFMQEAAAIPNVKVHGRLTGSELAELYAGCRILCNTSSTEGFPTTFLECWSSGMPVVTSYDPDGIVMREGLGRVGENAEILARELRLALADYPAYDRMSEAAFRYIAEHHSVKAVSRRFREHFEELLRPR